MKDPYDTCTQPKDQRDGVEEKVRWVEYRRLLRICKDKSSTRTNLGVTEGPLEPGLVSKNCSGDGETCRSIGRSVCVNKKTNGGFEGGSRRLCDDRTRKVENESKREGPDE